jgi:hypothetical protein
LFALWPLVTDGQIEIGVKLYRPDVAIRRLDFFSATGGNAYGEAVRPL